MSDFVALSVTVDGAVTVHHDWPTGDRKLYRKLVEGTGGGLVDVVGLAKDLSMWIDDEGMYGQDVNPVASTVAAAFGFTHQPYWGDVVFTGGVGLEGETLPLSQSRLVQLERLIERVRPIAGIWVASLVASY